jgi:hypothetical protein
MRYSKRLMVVGELQQDHVLIRLPFTLYCLPKCFALSVLGANEKPRPLNLDSLLLE